MCLGHLHRLMLLFFVCPLALHGAPVPGVTVTKRTASCCGGLNIPIDKVCFHRFVVGDRPLAQVNWTETDVRKPFHYFPDEDVMQLLDCVPFTHQIICDVGDIWQKEEIVHYQLTPCYKKDGAPNAATVIQGSGLSLFLTVALLIAMFC